MKVVVIGTGYVGLVTGTCFAEMGHHVTCVDVDADKIARLKQGVIPIYEPGLEPMVLRNYEAKRLNFVCSVAEAPKDAETWFIAVGTPPGEDGSADLQYVLAVAKDLGNAIAQPAVIVNKSTVPIGTGEKVHDTISSTLAARGAEVTFDVVSNPEFLKEGAAIDDFMKPDRIVVGTDSERATKVMRRLYQDFNRSHDRMIFMGIRDAELTKYAANAMLATRISFMNEMSGICEALDINIENIRHGIGSDPRIGYPFLYAGAGYGGSCFPKDVKALVQIAKEADVDPLILQAVEDRNAEQKQHIFKQIVRHFGTEDLTGKHFALWGLAFKPGTDDMRESPSIVLINQLIKAGATVAAFDPIAHETAAREFPLRYFDEGSLSFVDSDIDACLDADAVILITEWKQFRNPNFATVKQALKNQENPALFDGRNQYQADEVKAHGFTYYGIGRS